MPIISPIHDNPRTLMLIIILESLMLIMFYVHIITFGNSQSLKPILVIIWSRGLLPFIMVAQFWF